MTLETQNKTKKPKKTPDIEIRTTQTVEECATRIEAFSDSDAKISAQVALLPQDGKWAIEIATEYSSNPFNIMYFKNRFHGYLQRAEHGGSVLIGDVLPDVAMYITRGLYLVLLGPPLIFIALRIGFRFPFIWLITLGLIGFMMYMLVWRPENENKEKSEQLLQELTNVLK